MGTNNLPTVFTDSAGEIPSASKFNNNFSHVNFVQFNLIRGGDFEAWALGAALAPDNWTLSGSGAAVARSSDEKRSTYAAQITYGSAAAYLYQDSIELAELKGGKVKAWCWVKSSTADIARLRIDDGVGTTDSTYHTGGGTYEKLSVEHSVSGSATQVQIQLRVEGAGNATFDAAVLVDYNDATGYIPNIYDAAEILATASIFAYQAGAITARPAAPAGPTIYYATDIKQRYIYMADADDWEAF